MRKGFFMCKYRFFLVSILVQLSFITNVMALDSELQEPLLTHKRLKVPLQNNEDQIFEVGQNLGGGQPISSQPRFEESSHPGLKSYRDGMESMRKFGIVVMEDGSVQKCKTLQLFNSIREDTGGSLRFFRQSNELKYEPARTVLLFLLPHASGIYMNEAKTEPTALHPFTPPKVILPSITYKSTGSLPYGEYICGVQKALEIHYRLLLERRALLDQVLNENISDKVRTSRQTEREEVQSELQKTANFIGISSWRGRCCSLLTLVGVASVCYSKDGWLSLCGEYCGPKDHLTM